MGIIAKLPIVIGPGLPFAISFKAVLCNSPTIDRKGVFAANLIIGCILLCVAIIAKKLRAFAAIPEDFRLGMASGITALIACAAFYDLNIIEPNTGFLSIMKTNTDIYSLTTQEQANAVRIPVLSMLALILLTIFQVRAIRYSL